MKKLLNGYAAPRVPVTEFKPKPPVAPQAPLAGPPMNRPVGPPPPEVELPTTFEGFVDLAKKVSRGTMTDKALIWVGLAQAMALNRIGEELTELVDALHSTEKQPSLLGENIADGLSMALSSMVPGIGNAEVLMSKPNGES